MRNDAERKTGYIGVDILNNATICNETTALLERGVPLDLVSVYKFDEATFYQNESLRLLDDRIKHIYPLNSLGSAWDLIRAPFVFGTRFIKTCWKALTAKTEGFKQKFKTLAHVLPALRLAYYWRKRNIGHVHCQWAHTATTIGMHAAELLGIGFSFMGHANDLFVHRVALEDKVKRARFILCISEYHRRFFLDMGADPNRLHVVYCGVSLDRFQDTQEFDPTRKKIVSVGRLVEKKGFDDLIRSCGILRDRGHDFECVIAGSGPEESNLKKLIDELELADRVSITGKPILQEDIPDFLKSARIFSLPCVKDSEGDMDGLPQVLIESMACRVPAVSTYLVGIPDLIRHNENGILVETRNPEACANAMERLLVDDELTEQYGVEAEKWAKEHFGRSELARRLERIFNWALTNPGQNPPESLYKATPGSADTYENPQYESGERQPAKAPNKELATSMG